MSGGGRGCSLREGVRSRWPWKTAWPAWAASTSCVVPGAAVTSTPSPAAGVNTCDIITLYISAIKALRVLDPSMVILEVACEPVRRYLR